MDKKAALDLLWEESDDAIGRMCKLSEIYSNVPEHLDVDVWIDEFHSIEANKETRKKVIEWLNQRG